MPEIGLARGIVALQPHDPAWLSLFRSEADLLQAALKIEAEHVGSTAILGILAKPIIDVAVLLPDLGDVEAWISQLAEIGYWDKGLQADMPDRGFFIKGPDERRTVYLHVVDEAEFQRLIKFRDILNADKNLAAQYSNLKQALALQHATGRAAYTDKKNDFIQSVLKQQRRQSLYKEYLPSWPRIPTAAPSPTKPRSFKGAIRPIPARLSSSPTLCWNCSG